MKASVWVSTIAWGFLLLNNAALLGVAFLGHQLPEWPVLVLFAIPIYILLLPLAAHIRKWEWSTFHAGVSLTLWVPSILYCLQFWNPGQGG